MNQPHAVGGKDVTQFFKAAAGVSEVQLAAFFHQRIDHIDLPSFSQLATYAVIDATNVRLPEMKGLHRRTTGRQTVNDADVEVTIDGHGKGSGNRSGGHDEHVGRKVAFLPKLGTLFDAKTVLLVNDGKPQSLKAHLILNQSVGADKDGNAAISQAGKNLPTTHAFDMTRQKFHPNRERGTKFGETTMVLRSENLGGRHDAGLKTVVQRQKRTEQCHDGFPAAHVALQQTVHLTSAAQIRPYFLHDSLLSFGQREGKTGGIELMEQGTNPRKDMPGNRGAIALHHEQNVELKEEEFLKLHAVHRGTEVGRRIRKMNRAKRTAKGHQPVVRHDGRRQGFGKFGILNQRKSVANETAQSTGGESETLHALRRVILRVKAARRKFL